MTFLHEEVRDLCTGLVRARRVLRRFPAGHRLRDAGLKELGSLATRVLEAHEVTLTLRGGEVHWEGELVYSEPAAQPMLRQLSAAGVAGLHFARGTPACMVLSLATLLALDDGLDDLVARFRSEELSGVELRFTADVPSCGVERSSDPEQHMLLERNVAPIRAASAALCAAIETELARNLPAQAARFVLATLEPDSPRPDRATALALCAKLLRSQLVRFDLAGALDILEAADRCRALGEAEHSQLDTLCLGIADEAWLAHVLESAEHERRSGLEAFLVRLPPLLPRVLAHPDLARHATVRSALALLPIG